MVYKSLGPPHPTNLPMWSLPIDGYTSCGKEFSDGVHLNVMDINVLSQVFFITRGAVTTHKPTFRLSLGYLGLYWPSMGDFGNILWKILYKKWTEKRRKMKFMNVCVSTSWYVTHRWVNIIYGIKFFGGWTSKWINFKNGRHEGTSHC